MNPNENGLVERAYSAIPKNVKAAFFACFLAGFLVHLYAFTNIIPNCDGLSRVYDEQQMTVSGRWFLHYATMFHGYIQAPALIGGLSLLFLSISAGLCVDLLKIRSLGASILCGCFLSLTPAMAYTYLFTFTASAYAFGILLAVLSVWLTRRFRLGFLIGAIPMAASIGTYQAYFAAAAALSVICAVLDILDESLSIRELFIRIGKLLAMMAIGAVLYAVILVIFLNVKDLELLSYRGMNESFSITQILSSVSGVYKTYLKYFLVPNGVSYITTPITAAQLLLFLCAGITLIGHCLKHRRPLHILILFLALCIFPLACNFSELFSGSTPIMLYAFVMTFILAIVLIDRFGWNWVKRGAGILCLVILLLYAQIANIAYVSSATAHRATQTFATNLVSRVESTPGYDRDMEVIVIGGFPDDVYYSTVEGFELVEHFSCLSSSVMPRNKHIYYYMNDWLNVPWQEPEESLLIEISNSADFQSMALYPSDGSVRILDGRVVVKLAETYTPKKDYEIAYENRR